MVRLKPGRDLDLEIAKKVLKLRVWFDSNKSDWLCCNPKKRDKVVLLPSFSSNPEHAYTIVNLLQNQGYFCHVGSTVQGDKTLWRATFFKKEDKHATATYGETLAHAICLAAIELIGVDTPEPTPAAGTLIQFPKRPT